MTNQLNAIIIGGGHNGLVCATYLAKAGYSVQLLEARDTVGGAMTNRAFAEGFKVSGLAHVCHPLPEKIASDMGLDKTLPGPAIETLSLGRDGRHLSLSGGSVSGDGLSSKDVTAYTAFKKEFLSYTKALLPMTMNKPPRLKDMDSTDKLTLAKIGWKLRFGLGADNMSEFLRVGGINIYDVLNELMDDEQLKAAIAVDAVMGHQMGPRTPTTVLTYLQRLTNELAGPLCLPTGGMGAMAERLAEAATSAGVQIRTGAEVEGILVKEGRASGVRLCNGETLAADIVVSNADAKSTFLKLMDVAELDAMFVRRIHTTRVRGNVARLHFALNGLPQINGLSESQLRQRLLIAPDMRYIEHAFNFAKYGEFSESPVLEMTIPSLSDATMAPEGQHVLSVSASYAPYTLKTGWETGAGAFKDKVAELIESYAPGFQAQIIASEILTPVDIEREYHVTGGHWHHGELAIDQSFMMRPVHGAAQYDTPMPGLFLCGAAAHPGGGISGIPGHNSAKRIIAMKAGHK